MNRFKNIILITLLIISANSANSQDIGLKIGDEVPDFEIEKIINYTKKEARISDFKDQLLIVDFWSTGCSGCVNALPKMESLQKKFGDRLRILPVTYENEWKVKSFWNRNKYTSQLTILPSVVEDKSFAAYFKHLSIPHEVWIYRGKVIGITGPDYVDSLNIQKVLGGDMVDWPVKNDFYVYNGRQAPIFKFEENQPTSYVAIREYRPESSITGGEGIITDTLHSLKRVFYLNSSILNIYFLNLSKISNNLSKVPPATIESGNFVTWEVKDNRKYCKGRSEYEAEWMRKNAICFEAIHPISCSDLDISRKTIEQMNSMLSLDVRWEKRLEKVLVLVKKTPTDQLKSKTKIEDHDYHYSFNGTKHRFLDISLNAFVNMMNRAEGMPYVYNGTGFSETFTVDMELDFKSWNDIVAIRKAIQKYGLDLREEKRLVDKLVFSEVGFTKN